MRSGESLTLDLFNSISYRPFFTSMKSEYVYTFLTGILRAGESLTLDLFNSVLALDLSFTCVKPSYVYSVLADILSAG